MTLTRRTVALAALALTLVLGACSTPADVAAPGLEPQFGTASNDVGVDVAVTSTGSIAALSEERGSRYNDSYGTTSSYEKIVWSRYDSSGNLAWSTDIWSEDCASEDYYGEFCNSSRIVPRTIVRGASGSTYVAFTTEWSDAQYDVEYRVYKVDGSGVVTNSY